MRRLPVLTIAKRQLSSLRNEKTILFAILVQLFVALFSSTLVVGVSSLYDTDQADVAQDIQIGLSGDERNEISQISDDINTVVYSSRQEAENAYDSGDLNAVIHTTVNDRQQVVATVIAPEDGFLSTFSVIQARDLLQDYEQERTAERASSVNVEILRVTESLENAPPFISFIYTVLIPLLIILPSFISGAIIIDSLIEDEKIGMLELLQSAPITSRQLTYGKILVPLIIGPAQIMTWILLLYLNGINIDNPIGLLAVGIGLSTYAVSVATIVAQFSDNRGSAQFVYSILLTLSIAVTVILPEIPSTTIARLGLGSYDDTTVILATGYLIFGLVSLYVSVWISDRRLSD